MKLISLIRFARDAQECPQLSIAMETASHGAGVQGHSMYDANAHGAHDRHETHYSPAGHAAHDHGLMVAELKRRFWISLLLTLPILLLSPVIQHALGLGAAWRFSGDTYVLAVLASAIYFYGGWPFLQGL